jgi:hypothetical protein
VLESGRAGGAQLRWREALLMSQGGRQPAYAFSNFSEEFRCRAGAEQMQMLDTALQTASIEWVETDHGA